MPILPSHKRTVFLELQVVFALTNFSILLAIAQAVFSHQLIITKVEKIHHRHRPNSCFIILEKGRKSENLGMAECECRHAELLPGILEMERMSNLLSLES